MNDMLRFSPCRWFAPRESASRGNNLPTAPRDEIDSFFQTMFHGMVTPWEAMNAFLPFRRHQRAEAGILPSLDLTGDEKAYALSVELPGVEPQNVRLEVRDTALIIAGEKKHERANDKENCHVLERAYGSFQRVLALPDDADVDAITATHKNGVLHVAIPRKAVVQPQVKTIEITRE
ncbi:Hsp20/alpha crystallin family protein [uncultured Desulfovibrio sp.]|uniref:Hsp20/alpha crystallin family protein n=1 Tax=uncultured Desulfovibrio sp. TaxID=167968 RepID=UPI0026396E8B|nr:Hsp20/alpha crystallin family protein [uncultured Desulfovibrio sp.]